MTATAPILVFDGDCGFCTATATKLGRWFPGSAAIEPFQRLDLEPLGLTTEQCMEAVQFADPAAGTSPVAGVLALRGYLRTSNAPGRALALLITPVTIPLLGVGYRYVAKNRYRIPGFRDSTCGLTPRP